MNNGKQDVAGRRKVILAGRLDEEKATERRREKESVKMQTEQRLHADILTLTRCCLDKTASC